MAKPKVRANPALRLALIRQLHVWLSVFVAPSLIFFSVTGALQTFRVPDQKNAPVLLVKLARVHKDDVFAPKPPKPPRPEGAGQGAGHKPAAVSGPAKAAAKPSTELAKWFFAVVAAAVAVTAVLGLWMALAYSRDRWMMWILMIAGAAIPVAILAM